MQSILEQIYWGEYSPDGHPLSDREKAANALERVWRDAQERLGFEAADALRTGYWSTGAACARTAPTTSGRASAWAWR